MQVYCWSPHDIRTKSVHEIINHSTLWISTCLGHMYHKMSLCVSGNGNAFFRISPLFPKCQSKSSTFRNFMSKNVFWPFFQCPLLAHFIVNTSLYINIETTEGETGQKEIAIT